MQPPLIKFPLIAIAITFSLSGFFSAAQSAVVVSGTSSAAVSVNSSGFCASVSQPTKDSSTTTGPYSLSTGPKLPACDGNITTGAHFAQATGDPSKGAFSVTTSASRIMSRVGSFDRNTDATTSSSTIRTSFSVTNNGASSQSVLATNKIDAGAVGYFFNGPTVNGAPGYPPSTQDFLGTVNYSATLDGAVVSAGKAGAGRFFTNADLQRGSATILPYLNRTGIFETNSNLGSFSNDLGSSWFGVSWSDFLVNTDLGVFLPGQTKLFTIEVSA
jgi:hypothetical protein